LIVEEIPRDIDLKGKGKEVANLDDDVDANDNVDLREGYNLDDNEETATVNPYMSYTLALARGFDRVVYDEAHALKNINTLTHLAIKYLVANKI
jgi:hypothetical protein